MTLDPDTANPWLLLSDDGKQVNCGDVNKSLPDNPKRFSYYASVLGRQPFTSGRFYYEVQVKGKTKWDLGVTRELIDRNTLCCSSRSMLMCWISFYCGVKVSSILMLTYQYSYTDNRCSFNMIVHKIQISNWVKAFPDGTVYFSLKSTLQTDGCLWSLLYC